MQHSATFMAQVALKPGLFFRELPMTPEESNELSAVAMREVRDVTPVETFEDIQRAFASNHVRGSLRSPCTAGGISSS
jgi:hypothetical protein